MHTYTQHTRNAGLAVKDYYGSPLIFSFRNEEDY